MPGPKRRKGDQMEGRNKVFGAAVANVHVGIGHAALGNYSMRLQGVLSDRKLDTHLYAELNEIALSHATDGFRQFRGKTQSLCRNREQLAQHQTRIATVMLEALSNPEDKDFLGYLKASVAFFRDLGRDGIPLFEAFHAVANRALLDKAGYLIASTERVQLIFLAQVAWLRDVAPAFRGLDVDDDDDDGAADDGEADGSDDESGSPVATDDGGDEEQEESVLPAMEPAVALHHIVNLYVQQALSGFAVVRRLAMETLATLARRVPLVINEVVTASCVPPTDGEVDNGTVAVARNDDALVDALSTFAQELMAGLAGTLSTTFGVSMQRYLECFGLSRNSDAASIDATVRTVGSSALAAAIDAVLATLATARTLNIAADGVCTLVNELSTALDETPQTAAVVKALLSGGSALRCVVQATIPGADTVTEETRKLAQDTIAQVRGVLDRFATAATRASGDDKALEGVAALLAICTQHLTRPAADIPRVIAVASSQRLLAPLAAWLTADDRADRNSLALRFLQDVFEKNEARRQRMAEVDGAAADDKLATPTLPDHSHAAVARLLAAALKSTSVGVSAPLRVTFMLCRHDTRVLPALLSTSASSPTTAKTSSKRSTTTQQAKQPHLAHRDYASAIVRTLDPSVVTNTDSAAGDIAAELAPLVSSTLTHIESSSAKLVREAMASATAATWTALQRVRSDSTAEEIAQRCTLAGRYGRLWAMSKENAARSITDIVSLLTDLAVAGLGAADSALISESICFDNDVGVRSAAALRSMSVVVDALATAAGTSDGGLRSMLSASSGDAESNTSRLEKALLLVAASAHRPLRVAALSLLKQLHDGDALPSKTIEDLYLAEVTDPLAESGNIDAKQQHLTAISYRATSGTMSEPEARVVIRSLLGLLHLPFAAVWPVATTIISCAMKKHWRALWPELSPLLLGVILQTDAATSVTAGGERAAEDDDDADSVHEAAQLYDVQPSTEQRALASRGDASQKGYEFNDMTPRCMMHVLNAAVSARRTDTVTVARTVLGFLPEVFRHASSSDASSQPVVDSEKWALMLLDVEATGVQSPIRGLQERTVLLLRAMNAASKWSSVEVRQTMAAAVTSLLPHSNTNMQRIAVETLRRAKVRPFDAWHGSLLPFTEPTKKLMVHLNAFHAEDVPDAVRSAVVGAMVVLSIPRFEATGKAAAENNQAMRRVMSALTSLDAKTDLVNVVSSALAHLVRPAIERDAATTPESDEPAVFDFAKAIVQWTDDPKRRHRTGVKLAKAATSVVSLLARLLDAQGARMASWAEQMLHVVLHVSYFCASRSTGAAGAHGEGRTQVTFARSLAQASHGLSRSVTETIRNVLETCPAEAATLLTRDATCKTMFNDFVARQVAGIENAIVSTSNRVPAGVAILKACATREELQIGVVCKSPRPFIDAIVNTLAAATQTALAGRPFPSETVYAALNSWASLMANSEDDDADVSTSAMRQIVEAHSDRVFDALHNLVSRAQLKGNTSAGGGGASFQLSLALWKELLRSVAGTASMLDDGASSSATEAKRAGILRILLKFLGSPAAAADGEAAEVASDVAVAVAVGLRTVARDHFELLCALGNLVTRPRARENLTKLTTTLCCAGSWDWWPESEGTQGARGLAGRIVAGLNSFARDEQDDVDGESDGDEGDAADLSAYDFERRFHTTHAVSTGLAKLVAEIRPGKRSRRAAADDADEVTNAGATELSVGARRRERAYTGVEDVSIPSEFRELPRDVVLDVLSLVTSHLAFFLRDRERTIREAASQSLSAVITFGAVFAPHTSKDVDDNDNDASPDGALDDDADKPLDVEDAVKSASPGAKSQPGTASFLEAVVRRWLLASLRRGVVARDPAIRVEHLACFGYLARDLAAQFPSFAALYSRNADRNFFALVGSAQHRLRLNALSQLRAASDNLVVRDVLRIFVPYLVACLKDFAQGKKIDSTLTQGRFQGYAEGCMATMSHLAKRLPWEAYHYVFMTMLNQAKSEQALRAMLVKASSRLLDAFTFLPAQPSDPSVAPPELTRGQQRIAATLERETLPALMAFVVPPKKASGSAALSGVSMKGTQHSGANNSTSAAAALVKSSTPAVQLRVSVAIMKLLRWIPGAFELHAGPLLNEVVLKLRTKVDKTRIAARQILASMLLEVGPPRLGFVLQKLRDNFVHGYQLHVLGYTVAGLLEALAPQFEEENRAYQEAVAAAADDADAAARVRKPHLDRCLEQLMDVFLADYLGELGVQKELEELRASMVEIKKSRALDGFVFLARYAIASNALGEFTQKLRWLLTPDFEATARSNVSGSAMLHYTRTSSVNKKLLHGEKSAGIDLRFLERVRLLATRVARALLENSTLEASSALEFAKAVLKDNGGIRDAKIAEFEARDGTRRIRGNIERHTVQASLSRQDKYARNFEIADKPERVDVDFVTPTVLSTSNAKQKLLKYSGSRAKNLNDASKSFARQAPATAQELDVIDEFGLKIVLTFLQQLLGVGKAGRKQRQARRRAAVGQASKKRDTDATGGEDDEGTGELDDDLNIDIEVKPQQQMSARRKTARAADDDDAEGASDDDEEEQEEGADDDDERQAAMESLEERRAEDVTRDATDGAEQRRRRRGRGTRGADAEARAQQSVQHAVLLNELVRVVISALRGEGSDAVVTNALDVLHGLIAISPPLDALTANADVVFSTVVGFFDRGTTIKTRALRVAASLAASKKFELRPDDAKRLTLISRAEVVERSEFLPGALSLLLSVVTQRVAIPEVFDIISPVTELLLQSSTSPTVRNRCVAIIAKFLTEYSITREKLKSHVDLYLRNLSFPEAHGRTALLELIHVLVFRFPTPVLREEAAVIFVPLVHTMTSDDSGPVREGAARVVLSLMANAGLDVFAPIMYSWLSKDAARFTDLAAQLLPFYVSAAISVHTGVPCGKALLSDNAEQFAAEMEKVRAALLTTPDASQAVQADVEWLLPHMRILLCRDPAEGERRQGQEVPLRRLRELQQRNWASVFYSVRAAEVLIEFDAMLFGPGLARVVRETVLERLVAHTHPWVQTASIRLSLLFFRKFVATQFRVLDLSCEAALSTAEDQLPPLPLVTIVEKSPDTDGTPRAADAGGKARSRKKSRAAAEAEAAADPLESTSVRAASNAECLSGAQAVLKRLCNLIGELDVDERYRHTVNKALVAPLRHQLQDLFVFVATMCLRNSAALGGEQHVTFVAETMSSLARLVRCVTQAGGIKGHCVRTVVVLELCAKLLDDALSEQPAEVAGAIGKAIEGSLMNIARVIGICTLPDAKEHNDRVYGIAVDVAGQLKNHSTVAATVTTELAKIQAGVKQQRTDEQTRAMHAKTFKTLSRVNKQEKSEFGVSEKVVGADGKTVLVGGRVVRDRTLRIDDGMKKHSSHGQKQGQGLKRAPKGAMTTDRKRVGGAKAGGKKHRTER